MKKILFSVFVAAALGMIAVSCSKQDAENAPVQNEEAIENVIYASFDNGVTKTTDWQHDGKTTPVFEVGDQIKVYSSSTSAIGTVTAVSEEKIATIKIPGIDLTGDVYAIYPVDAAAGYNAGTLTFTIPATQNGSFGKANISVAKLNGTRFNFKNVTSLFKVTAKPEVITSFVFNKTGIAGTFTVNFTGYDVNPIQAVSTSDQITVNNIEGTGPYYIAVATGLSYSKDELIANYYNESNERPVGIKNANKNIGPFVRSKIYNIGDAKLNYSLDGKFTVRPDGHLVYFAKGNMFWDGDTYEFEPNQWDINYVWDPNHVTHFYFCTDQENAYAQTYFDPWGDVTTINDILFTNATSTTPNPNLVISGDKGLWRCLSIAEWKYLIGIDGAGRILNGGTGRGYTFDFAMIGGEEPYGVGGTFGVVIYDDGYKGTVVPHTIVTPADPYGMTGVVGVTEIPENSVFIPGNGVRDGVNSDGTEWGMNICGFYWTSESAKVDGMVPANICAHTFDYSDNGNLYNTDSWFRAYASCIRPVADVQ